MTCPQVLTSSISNTSPKTRTYLSTTLSSSMQSTCLSSLRISLDFKDMSHWLILLNEQSNAKIQSFAIKPLFYFKIWTLNYIRIYHKIKSAKTVKLLKCCFCIQWLRSASVWDLLNAARLSITLKFSFYNTYLNTNSIQQRMTNRQVAQKLQNQLRCLSMPPQRTTPTRTSSLQPSSSSATSLCSRSPPFVPTSASLSVVILSQAAKSSNLSTSHSSSTLSAPWSLARSWKHIKASFTSRIPKRPN